MSTVLKLVLLVLIPLGAAAQPVMKTIELDWDEVPGAASYEIKLTPKQDKIQPLFFTTQNAHLDEQVPVGTYELRIRSRAKEDDVYSPWSDPMDVEVVAKNLEPLAPIDKAVIESKGRFKDSVQFSWTKIDKVKDYTITIWTEDGKDKPFTFTTKGTSKRLTVKTGHRYFWQVTFHSSTETSYAQSPPTFSFTLLGPKLLTPVGFKVTRQVDGDQLLSWAKSGDAKTYHAQLFFRFLDETDYHSLAEKDVEPKVNEWNAGNLHAGAYKLELIAKANGHVDSDKASFEFVVKPTERQLLGATANSP